MTDQSRHPGDTGRGTPPPTPRWVWVSAVVVVVLIAAAVVLALVSGGEHGPALHTSSGAPATSTHR